MNVIKNSWKLQYWKQSRSKQISVVRVPRYKTAKNISLRFPSSIHCSVNIWGHWKSTFAIGIIVHRTRLKINFEFQNPCNITSVIIQLSDYSNPFLSRGVGNGGRRAPSEFSVSVNVLFKPWGHIMPNILLPAPSDSKSYLQSTPLHCLECPRLWWSNTIRIYVTLPTAEILSGKNARVSMVSYLKK